MNVLTIVMARDEQDLIPYFVRHYRRFGDVTVFDDHSDDDTVSLARAEGATVLRVDDPDIEVEYRLLRVKNDAWKPVRQQYDWVIVVDVDEFLYHKDLTGALQDAQARGATILEPQGYQMVSGSPPCKGGLITDEIRRGAPCQIETKRCCFNPQQLTEINYSVGAHHANPQGIVVSMPYQGLKLLHYHFIDVDRVMALNARRIRWRAGLPIPKGWRDHKETREQLQATFDEIDAKATKII